MILKNLDDFKKLLDREHIPADKQTYWLKERNPDAAFATLAFCVSIWDQIVNPADPRHIDYGPGAKAPSKKILNSILAKGVSKEEIAEVVRDYQLDIVYRVLMTIEQFDIGAGESSVGFSLLGFDPDGREDGVPIEGGVPIENDIVDMFMSAKPEQQAEVAQYG